MLRNIHKTHLLLVKSGSKKRTGAKSAINQRKKKIMETKMCLHAGAELVGEDAIYDLPPSDNETTTHIPIEHSWLLDRVKSSLTRRGTAYGEGQFALTPDNECMFGLIPLPDVRVPSIDARCQLFKDSDLDAQQRHHLLVRMLQAGSGRASAPLKPTELLDVEREYLRSDEEVLRDEHSRNHNAWRLLQAYTHTLQRGGRYGNDNNRLQAIADKTQVANRLIQNFVDPDGSRVEAYKSQPELFDDPYSVCHSYQYVLGLRNSNNKRFAAGMVIGIAPFVCDNLAFSGEVKLARKHTVHIKRDLPMMIDNKLDRLLLEGLVMG
jgi:hypothetical protein